MILTAMDPRDQQNTQNPLSQSTPLQPSSVSLQGPVSVTASPQGEVPSENPLYSQESAIPSFQEQSSVPPPFPQEQGPSLPEIGPPESGGGGMTTPPVVSEGNPGGGGRRFPLKTILISVLAIVILGSLAYLAQNFLFKNKGPSEKDPVIITYWGLWEESSTITGLISEYESQNKGVKIKYTKQSKDDYRERLANSLAKGEGPDIFRYHNTWVPMLSSHLGSLPPTVMDAATFQKTFYPVASQDLRRGADIVGIPLMFDGLGLYINETIFNQAGKNPPATWDELRKMALELTVKDEGGNIQQAGVALGRTDNVDHWEDVLALMMLQNGADLANPVGKLAEDSLAFFTVFSKSDVVWDGTLPPSTQAFAAGKLAMYFGPSWRAFEVKTQNPNLSFRVVPVPQLPKSRPNDPDITWASYWAEGVWTKSKYQEEAWKFLEFLSSKESLQKMYQSAAASRLFGPPYPIQDMAPLLENDPVVGAYVKQAPFSRSWYLTSRTFDGPTGLNSKISAYFADAVNAVVDQGKEPQEVLTTVASGVKQILSNYSGAF